MNGWKDWRQKRKGISAGKDLTDTGGRKPFQITRLNRRAQKILTILTGTALTLICCLLAERYARGGREDAIQTLGAAEAGSVLIIDYHQVLPTQEDVEAAQAAGESSAITLAAFKEDLEWLMENGAGFVLPSGLKRAVQGLSALPSKAVMLTFTGGYESFYTVVWPQLREAARNSNTEGALSPKGCVGVIGAEAELYSGSVEKEITTSRLSWNQIRQLDQSDCVEIASQGYDLCLDAQEWMKPVQPAGRLSSLMQLLGLSPESKSDIAKENLLLYYSAVGKDSLTMGEKMRQTLFHEADAFFVPDGCGGTETDQALVQSGITMTMLAGSCDGPLDGEDPEENPGWNLITDHASLQSMTRLLRPNEGSLEDVAAAYFEDYSS